MSKSDVLLKKLLISQMVMEGMNMATIDFFKNIYAILYTDRGVGCPKMAQKGFVTRQNANLHCRRLEEAGYLERKNYRSWRLSQNPLRDVDLVEIGARMSISLPAYETSAAYRDTEAPKPRSKRVSRPISNPQGLQLVFF